MKLASAQINCTVGEIEQNLKTHYTLIELAIKNKVDLILFPEMSIIGYCRKEASKYIFTEEDPRLNTLKEISKKGNIIIITGAPININEQLYIGSFIINPDGSTQIYTKQHLHKGEELFFNSSMNHNPIVKIKNVKISLAICADINNEKHPCQAQRNNCSIYLPSIFYSENGIEQGHKQLKKYAKKYSLNILMSNYSGELWGIKAGGKSTFWNSKGEVLKTLATNQTGLLIIQKKNDNWSIKSAI